MRPNRAAPALTAQPGISQLHDEVGVSSTGPAGVDAGIKGCSDFQAFVAQQLPDQFVGAGVGVEDDFCGQMAELVRSYPGILTNTSRDRRSLPPPIAPPFPNRSLPFECKAMSGRNTPSPVCSPAEPISRVWREKLEAPFHSVTVAHSRSNQRRSRQSTDTLH